MKTAIAALGLALGANAAPASTIASSDCCFSIDAYGIEGSVSEGYWGPVKQLTDGQLRVGQWNLRDKSRFCLNKNNYGLIDQNGFGCLIAGWEKQFQCDSGKAPVTGWDVGCEGIVTYYGSASFYACATGDHGGYNVYTSQLPGGYCSLITLIADQCKATCEPLPETPTHDVECVGVSCQGSVSSDILPPTPLPTPECTSSSGCTSESDKLISLKCPGPDCTGHEKDTCHGKSECYKTWKCPDVLKGAWQFPHLIVPVSSYNPTYAPGTQYFGTVSARTRSYFKFDIPQEYEDKQCSVKFMLPNKGQLETSDFTLRGSGYVKAGVTEEFSPSISWNTAPDFLISEKFQFEAGYSYVLHTTDCRPGVLSIAIEGISDTYLHWFQDYNPCPIGLYVTAE